MPNGAIVVLCIAAFFVQRGKIVRFLIQGGRKKHKFEAIYREKQFYAGALFRLHTFTWDKKKNF